MRIAVPQLDGILKPDGIDAPIEVFRDPFGIPHARARTVHDAFFAQGFVHAQDRLWQMDLDRRKAAGRSAAVLGASFLAFDVFVRRLDLIAAARADYDAFDAETRSVLDAYAEGVNASMEAARALPIEFALLGTTPDPWRPWDATAVLKVRHVLMSNVHMKLWRARLARVLGRDAVKVVGSADGREDVLVVPMGDRSTWRADPRTIGPGMLAMDPLPDGSNNWVVHGSRTASGKPLLAGDPHRALEAPNVYYQNRIACPEFDTIGLSMPGVPGIFHFGHNGTVGWCITHAMADTQDLFVERFAPDGSHEFRGELLPSARREEVVDVRDGASHRIDVTVTGHGPVVFGDPASGTAIAMRWTGTDAPNASLRGVLPMLRARTVDEVEEAMRHWVDPCNNMLIADGHGTVAYLHRGRVPVRDGANAWLPVPGWTGEHEWTGDVPFESLPRLRDPDDGFIATANNRVCGDDYPHYLGMDYSPANRARRLIERLEALHEATAQDMAAIHSDRVSLPSRTIAALVARVAPSSARAAEMREVLLAWDGAMDPDAVAPSVYATLRWELADLLLERDPLSATQANPFPEEPFASPARARIRSAAVRLIDAGETRFNGGASWEELAAEALERTAATLSKSLGDDAAAWTWDRTHLTQTRHPLSRHFPDAARALDPERLPLGGDGDCVLAGSSELGSAVQHSSVARYVFDLGDPDRSAWVVPLGSSGHPASAHYADQARAWSDVRLHAAPYSWDVVERSAESRQELAK